MNGRTVIPVGVAVALGLCAAFAVRASDHLDPPAIAADPATDIADVYAFGTPGTDVTPGTADDTFVMVMTVAGELGFDVRYTFQVDEDPSDDEANGFTSDSTASVEFTANEDPEGPPCMQFAFRTLAFDSCQLPEIAVSYDEETGDLTVTVDLPDPLPGVVRIFAGLRDDPFFFDAVAFRTAVHALEEGRVEFCADSPGLCQNGFIGPLSTWDSEGSAWGPIDLSLIGPGDTFAGGSVHAIVIEAPALVVAGEGGTMLSAYAATYRRAARLRTPQGDIERGPWVQMDRLAVPALSTGLIPPERQLEYNRDDVNNSYADLLGAALVGLRTAAAENLAEFNYAEGSGFGEDRDPPPPFLGLVDPTALLPLVDPDVVHLNTIREGTGAPSGSPLDPLFPQFPNGRTLSYDAMDTVLSLVLGVAVTDDVDANDCPFQPTFPYLAEPGCSD